MIKSVTVSLLFVLLHQVIIAQTGHHPSGNQPDTIPIKLTEHNNIAVQAILNEQDTLTLMLHTAVNEVSLTTAATANMRSIKFNAVDTVETWGGRGQSRYSAKNSLAIEGFSWDHVSIWEGQHSGHHTDGKFGLNLFEGKIVELNVVEEYMVIHDQLPQKADAFTSVKVINKDGIMFIEGTCKIDNEMYPNEFLIHSGYSGSVLLDDDFVKKHELSGKVEVVKESILKDSYGNELKTINAILPAFQLAEVEFTDVPVGFFAGSINRQKMSVLGGGMLKRFHIIFDVQNSKVYLTPNGV